MKKIFSWMAVSASMAGFAGCAVAPTTIVQGPTSVRPVQAPAAVPGNGAIFQVTAYRPMFEDRRARLVGDLLTITISENTSAAKGSGNSASKTGSTSFAAPSLFGLSADTTAKLALSTSGANKFEEKGASSASNTFTGTIGVTVVEVLVNGNLMVSGEKQIAFDKGSEFVRFSGVVSPDTIGSGNLVSSTQVADARVEYRTNSHIDKAEMMSLMTRFFLSMMPL